MSTLPRYLEHVISQDLKKKMIFLGGPRQVGKTTFSQNLIPHYRDGDPAYLNWDDLKDRKRLLAGELPLNAELIVIDEVHKFARWRGLIKGFYDKLKNTHRFLVTGSARLDHYRKGGDSLLGRYHYYRLHPLTLAELQTIGNIESVTLTQSNLLKFGGFPEPFLEQSEKNLKRWHRQRRERIIYSDIRDLENIKEISNIELLVNALPERVGSPLSRKNLAQTLEVDFKTVEKWLSILESVYYCYRLSPFGQPRIKAVKKEQKLYFWDWSELEDRGARWENFIASHLLKYCHFLEDTEGDLMELRFLRDTSGREVDFVVMKNKKPLFAVECKTGEKKISPHLDYFCERTTIPMFYQVHGGVRSFAVSDRIKVLPLEELCRLEGLR